MLKTHNCGDLRISHAGQTVTLAGWVNRRRDHGGVTFLDLRDRSGLAQVVINPEQTPALKQVAGDVRNEWVLQIKGTVNKRPAGTENAKLPTGTIEVAAGEVTVLNQAKTPPFYINEDSPVDDSLRQEYRYLDLRRQRMQHNIILRHKLVQHIRDFLNARDFLDVETPILFKSTPEGAREYLVPSRVYPGKFFALAQSPQQLKQMLMVAGYERYYQIARCFRDEDSRADRQMEFTQLDLEMSFVEQEDILRLMEEIYTSVAKRVAPEFKLAASPFPRLSYEETMRRYGSDKPDLRYGLELSHIEDLVKQTEFAVFKGAVAAGGVIKAINAPGMAAYSRKQVDELTELAKSKGAKGLVSAQLTGTGDIGSLKAEDVRSPVAKYLPLEQVKAIANRVGAKQGDMLLIVAGDAKSTNAALDGIRRELAERLKLADPKSLAYAFIIDIPLLEWSDTDKKFVSTHHPFTSPNLADVSLLDTAPGKVRALAYDLACNGYEVAGGSIRIHDRALQQKMFGILGLDADEIQAKFGYMLRAFEYGAPPHGGFASGIDRWVMILAGEKSIADVIAYPKSKSASDLLTGSPSPASEAQLKELGIEIRKAT
ncbi:MAG: aspartate--tRNA ligase [Chloroflexi bacterium]|nr:aspartate--tRNA ligase [Chloroflexota bacterium]